MPAPRLDTGRTYVVRERFDYDAPDGHRWDIAVGSRVVVMERRPKDAIRVRCGVLTFNVGGAWLAERVTATEGK